MSDNSDKEGDIFDNIDSSQSDIEDNIATTKNKTNQVIQIKTESPPPQRRKSSIHAQAQTPPAAKKDLIGHTPLPIMEGPVSLGPDMKFGWKPEVDFESAPIPLYFNFIEHPMQTYYEEQQYYQNSTGNRSNFKIIYYGPRFKDSFEMHKNFVKPAENTYEFNFPKFYGIASAKAFYDSVFEDMMDGEAPRRDEMREFIGMSPDVEWNELCFNSNFENGNLDMVVKTGENTYDLFLRVDTNTRGHFNWFHFEVSKTRKGRTVHFNIVNMSKRDSLYNHGMQINYWSQQKNSPSFCGWQRGGSNISYGRSKVAKEHSRGKKKYYCLSFDFTFEHDNDKIWFASTIPYSYSMLTQYIKSIVQEQKNHLDQDKLNGHRSDRSRRRGKYIQESVLCKSLGGVDVPLLTITNFEDYNWQKKKKIVFVQARIHPGETASSWICHGLISFLVSRSKVAVELRKRLVFKIIPMCNPDGVIIGNTRTTLIGKDMNRQYALTEEEEVDPKLNPIPNAIKDLITQLLKDDKDKIFSFWDLHQHSKKKSIFIYGPYYPLHTDKYLKIRIIAKLLSEISQMFRFFSCRFRIEKYKENCARITIGKMFNITNCFTMECSSYGYITKDRETVQFREEDLIEFGKNMAECILEYCLILERDKKAKEEIKERMKEKKKKRKPLMKELLQTDQSPTKVDKSPKRKQRESDEESNMESDSGDSGDGEGISSEEDDDFNKYLKNKSTNKVGSESPSKRQKEEGDKESEDDDDDDRFYSDEEGGNSPVTRPSDLKGLLKHKQKKSNFDIKAYSGSGDKMSKQIRSLDQILQMIQSDIIHEEKYENDSNPSIGDSSSGSSGSEEDDLDLEDQQVLKDRIMNAIQVFSKWSPNPRKDILKQKRFHKLSIENRSRASSRKSKGSETKRSASEQNDLQFPQKQFDQQRSTPLSPLRQRIKPQPKKQVQQKEAIDNFLKEFGLSSKESKATKLYNNLSLIGNKIGSNQFNEIDDEILSTISNEILKQRKKKLKKGTKQKNQGPGDLLMVKSFGTNKGVKIGQTNNWIADIANDSDSSQVVGSARKVILQKYFNQNGSTNEAPSIDNSKKQLKQGSIRQEVEVLSQIEHKPITQKILTFGLTDEVANHQQLQQTKPIPKVKEENKNSHLLGYDNKIALLNQAIMHKKQQQISHQRRSSASEVKSKPNQYNSVIYYSQIQDINTSQTIKIPSAVKIQNTMVTQSVQKQVTQQIHNTSKVQQQQQLQSFESVVPPFISCQIHPTAKMQPASHLIKHRRNISAKAALQKSIKVNAATDTNINEQLEVMPKNVNSRQVHFIDQVSKGEYHNRSQNTLTDQSMIMMGGNVYDQQQRQIISSKSKFNQLQLDKIKNRSIHQIKEPQKQKKENVEYVHYPNTEYNSLKNEIERTHQISLQQWQLLNEKGLMPNDMLMIDNVKPFAKYSAHQSQQVSYQSTARGSYNQTPLKSTPLTQSQIIDKMAKNIQDYRVSTSQQRPQSSYAANYNKGKLSRGRPQSQAQERTPYQSQSLLIKNEYVPEKSRFNMFKQQVNNNNSMMEYFEANKKQIVRDIIMKNDGLLLGRRDDGDNNGGKDKIQVNMMQMNMGKSNNNNYSGQNQFDTLNFINSC